MRVLYVEDDPSSQRLVQRGLEHEGFEVTVADNGLRAIELLKKQVFDALVLDIMMPGIDGFQVGRSARRDSKNRDIPIIFLTAHSFALREADAKWLEPVASLTKPVKMAKLAQALHRAEPKTEQP